MLSLRVIVSPLKFGSSASFQEHLYKSPRLETHDSVSSFSSFSDLPSHLCAAFTQDMQSSALHQPIHGSKAPHLWTLLSPSIPLVLALDLVVARNDLRIAGWRRIGHVITGRGDAGFLRGVVRSGSCGAVVW